MEADVSPWTLVRDELRWLSLDVLRCWRVAAECSNALHGEESSMSYRSLSFRIAA